jgi:hypothetical protein
MHLPRFLAGGLALLVLTAGAAAQPEPARTDYHGDLLPEGALQRLGMLRSRQLFQLCFMGADVKPPLQFAEDDAITYLRPTPNGTWVVTATPGTRPKVWESATGRPVALPGSGWPGDPEQFSSEALHWFRNWTPDGRFVVTWHGAWVFLLEQATGKERLTFAVPGPWAVGVRGRKGAYTLSPDGHWLATAQWDGDKVFALQVWEVRTGGLVQSLTGLNTAARDLAFAPDSMVLAAAGSHELAQESLAQIWDVASGELLARVGGHAGAVTAVAFGPDGRTFLTGGADGIVLIWDAAALGCAPPLPPRQAAPGELEGWWKDLAGSASRAFPAILALTAAGKDGASFLQGRLEPAAELPRRQVWQAVADLDDPRYAVRARAMLLLTGQGGRTELALRAALQPGMSLEMRRRVDLLLDVLARLAPPAELRQLRALIALERIGGREARALLALLAVGASGSCVTQEARAALERLERTRSWRRSRAG